jgi:hypothetical protein
MVYLSRPCPATVNRLHTVVAGIGGKTMKTMKTIEELSKMDGWDLVRLAYELQGYEIKNKHHCPSGFYYQCGHEGKLLWDYPANYCYDLNEVRKLEEIVLQKWKELYKKSHPDLCQELAEGTLQNAIYKAIPRKNDNTIRTMQIYQATAMQRLLACILSMQEFEEKS